MPDIPAGLTIAFSAYEQMIQAATFPDVAWALESNPVWLELSRNCCDVRRCTKLPVCKTALASRYGKIAARETEPTPASESTRGNANGWWTMHSLVHWCLLETGCFSHHGCHQSLLSTVPTPQFKSISWLAQQSRHIGKTSVLVYVPLEEKPEIRIWVTVV